MRKFLNRMQAGVMLSERLLEVSLKDPLILALPRGGVPVAFEIAKALGAPLDVLIVRKVGAPGQKELGIGAITEDGHYWIDLEAAQYVGAKARDVEETLEKEREELRRRRTLYRGGRPLPPLRGRSVIVVDDGLATGATARVACAYLRQAGAAEVILAVPVAAPRAASIVQGEVDQFFCLSEPAFFHSVGQFYENFEQLEDAEVLELLDRTRKSRISTDDPSVVTVDGNGLQLGGSLSVPANPLGLVIFAHGSGSSRHSPRNQEVARALNRAGIATLLFDLLTLAEAENRKNVFDIPLLASRLNLATDWARRRPDLAKLPVGYFGASTGAAAALWAAAESNTPIAAVVSRGGRPDLADRQLKEVPAPTLLLVGSLDHAVIDLNETALRELRNGKLTIIPGAGHLFEEPGTLARVEKEAIAWFVKHFTEGASDAVA
jgi:putative phosphoribosyl transferase